MKLRLLSAAFAVSAVCAPAITNAEPNNCGDRNSIVQRLEARYGERRSAAGLTAQNGMVEVFASEESGSWTILITMPTGQSCLVAAGEHWQPDTPLITSSGAPV